MKALTVRVQDEPKASLEAVPQLALIGDKREPIEISSDIAAELLGRLVSPRRLLAQCLGKYAVNVSFKLSPKTARTFSSHRTELLGAGGNLPARRLAYQRFD